MAKIVEVDDADEMDDETFLKHIDKRHPEARTEKAIHKFPHIAEAWVGPYRAYHEYMHRTAPENFNHEHVWDDDDGEE